MAVLHSYSESSDQRGYYLKGWTPETGNTTLQTRHICEDLFEWLGYSVGDQIPHDLLNGLLEVGLLYTGDPTTPENVPDDFDFSSDVKNVLTKDQYERLIGFAKSYGDSAPNSVERLIDQLDARTAVVDDACIPDASDGFASKRENNTSPDHGQFENIVQQVYVERDGQLEAGPFEDLNVEGDAVDVAVSYHRTGQEVTTTRVVGDRLEYATRATLADGSAGPRCGLRIGRDLDDLIVVETVTDPEDVTRVLDYGEPGVRHRLVLFGDDVEWETTIPPQHSTAGPDSRTELLEHQVSVLEILDQTLAAHNGIECENLVAEIVGGGYLEKGLRRRSLVWDGSSLLGNLLSTDEDSSGTQTDGKVTGTVDFFNDTGGYGFIETDAHDEDVFYHMEDIGGPDINEGQELEFEIVEADKGPRAKNVSRL